MGARAHSRLHLVGGYRWYDWKTGAVDRCRLAEDATRAEGQRYSEPPDWLEGIPAVLPRAMPAELAILDARARRAYVYACARGDT